MNSRKKIEADFSYDWKAVVYTDETAATRSAKGKTTSGIDRNIFWHMTLVRTLRAQKIKYLTVIETKEFKQFCGFKRG